MVDGPTEPFDLEHTETNRALVREFTERVLVGGQLSMLEEYVSNELVSHDPEAIDGLAWWRETLHQAAPNDRHYERLHRVLAEGGFVLAVSEGRHVGVHSALYDRYRVSQGRIVEHWNTIETVAPRSEWKNDNGKF